MFHRVDVNYGGSCGYGRKFMYVCSMIRSTIGANQRPVIVSEVNGGSWISESAS